MTTAYSIFFIAWLLHVTTTGAAGIVPDRFQRVRGQDCTDTQRDTERRGAGEAI